MHKSTISIVPSISVLALLSVFFAATTAAAQEPDGCYLRQESQTGASIRFDATVAGRDALADAVRGMRDQC